MTAHLKKQFPNATLGQSMTVHLPHHVVNIIPEVGLLFGDVVISPPQMCNKM